MSTPLPGPVVGPEWLAAHLGEVSVADVRWSLASGPARDAYARGHLPGAVFVDLDADLASAPSPTGGRHPLPSPERFAEALGRLGIGEDRPVVAYDDAGGSTAARMWWMLRSIGQPAAVLDGGVAGWRHGLSTGTPVPAPVRRTPRPWPPGAYADEDAVASAPARGAVLLDARSSARYERGDPGIDPRPGHIPGARSAPWQDNLDADGATFKAPGALRARFEALGVRAGTEVIAYCGSGVTACHDLLALELAGFGPTALYPGSWSAWGADPDRPASVGPDVPVR